MSREPQWKRDGVKNKATKTPKNARRKRQKINHWRKNIKRGKSSENSV